MAEKEAKKMPGQLFYEAVEVGTEITPLVKHPTIVQLVKYAGAVRDWSPYNFDREYAHSIGLSDILVTGSLILGFLAQMVTDWIGEDGTLRKLSCSHRAQRHPGADIICKGKVTSKYVEDGQGYVECEIWAENAEGQRSTPGIVLVTLPFELKTGQTAYGNRMEQSLKTG
ncbi:hypothetical protein ACFLYR_00180 [Chloroflexota bacterium]